MNQKHTGYAVTEMLIEYGVEYIFGIPGGQTLPLYDASYHYRDRIKHILMRDERNAGHAASAYSRISGKVGVCDATVGPGATNLPSALGEALNSATPLLAIIGEHPTTWINKIHNGRASQGIDQISMLKPTVKRLLYAPRQEVVPELLKTAFVEATTGRSGPVALVIPADVFRQEFHYDNLDQYIDRNFSTYPAYRTLADPARIIEAVKLLKTAQKPVMLIGGGAMHSGAMDVVRLISEELLIPIVYTITGKGILPDDHPLNMGVAGIFANTSPAETALRQADLIFMVGCKNSQSSSFAWSVPTPQQKVIHLDIDPSEVGIIYRTDVGLIGDARLTLEHLYSTIKTDNQAKTSTQDWLSELNRKKLEWETKKQELFSSSTQPIKPYRMMDALNKTSQPEDILVCDAGFASAWGAIYSSQKKAGRQQIYPRGLAGLGFAIAAGVGAKLAAPHKRVVTLSGDAGASYDISELAVEAQLNLAVVNIILNNSAYGWVKWAEKAWYNNSFEASALQSINFAKIAEGFGCVGIRVEKPEELENAFEHAFSLNRPVVMDIICDSESTPVVRE
ncbi:MAG: thiamine pyrophosphate-binding protein [Chloroflexota bacterium]